MKLNSLTLGLTERCNLNCYYCFAPKSNKDIRLDTAIASVEFLLKNSGNYSDMGFVFFGGEPLIRFDLIKEIVRYAKARATIMGKRFKFSITTNGTLLTGEIADFFRDNRFKVIINYDGDRRRVNKIKGELAFDKILNSVKLLNEREIDVDARITIEPSDMRLVDFVESASKVGFKKIFMIPIFLSDIDEEETHKEMTKLADLIIESIIKREPLLVSDISEAISRILGLNEMPSRFCEAGYSGVTADVEGNIMPCARFNAWHEDFLLGDIFEGKIDSKKEGLFASVSNLTMRGCESCPAKTSCGGVCVASNYEANKDLNIPEKSFCVWRKAMHKAATHIVDKLYIIKKEPAFIDWVLRLNHPWKIRQGVEKISLVNIESWKATEITTEFYFDLKECDLEHLTGNKILKFLERIKKEKRSIILRRPLPPCIFDEGSKIEIDKYNFPRAVINFSSESKMFKKSFIELFDEYKLFAKIPEKCRDCRFRLDEQCHYAYFGFDR